MQGPHTRAVACHLCNEKFFPKSLPFHVKQCEKRRATRHVNCPYCGTDVVQADLAKHVENCPKGGGKKQASSSSGRGGKESGDQKANMGPAQYDAEILPDGRMRCVYCGRCFGPERIEKHQSICGGLKNARPRGVDGEPTQTAAKVFDATAQRLGQGAAFCTPAQYEKRKASRNQGAAKQRATSNNWRRQHAEFIDACRAGRGEETVSESPARRPATGNDGLVPCPHCNRRFERSAAERHVPICANIRNRPKPPPSPSPSSRGAPASPAISSHGAPSPVSSSRGGGGAPPIPPKRGGTPRRVPIPPTYSAAPSDGHTGDATLRPESLESSSGSINKSASCGQLPTLDASNPRSSVGSANSGNGGARSNSSGAGMRAARGLKSTDSQEKLPGLRSPAPRPSDSRQSSLSRRTGAQPSDAIDDRTMPSSEITAASSQKRMGLRRSAMLYRLLSQVPDDGLTRELGECGVTSEGMDREEMIEAIFEQLS